MEGGTAIRKSSLRMTGCAVYGSLSPVFHGHKVDIELLKSTGGMCCIGNKNTCRCRGQGMTKSPFNFHAVEGNGIYDPSTRVASIPLRDVPT